MAEASSGHRDGLEMRKAAQADGFKTGAKHMKKVYIAHPLRGGSEEMTTMQKMKRKNFFRRFWERLTGRNKGYVVLRMPLRSEIRFGHEAFLSRCSDGDMATRFGRPDIYVADLERVKNA